MPYKVKFQQAAWVSKEKHFETYEGAREWAVRQFGSPGKVPTGVYVTGVVPMMTMSEKEDLIVSGSDLREIWEEEKGE